MRPHRAIAFLRSKLGASTPPAAREPSAPPDRREIVRSFIDPARPGLEIGPSHLPICPKSEGYQVEIVDHLSAEGLRQKYTGHGVNLDAIEPVDHIWHGESYAELTGRKGWYSWIVASHLVEHTPDLVGFLQSCEEVLTDDGVLALVIPDKRFCFDYLRARSSLAAVIDAHEAKRTNHTVGTAVDYFLNVCRIEPKHWWTDASVDTLSFIHGIEDGNRVSAALRAGEFVDLHSWCFTPSSFRLVVSDLYDLGLTKLRETQFVDTIGLEFFVGLSKSGKGYQESRMDMAVRAAKE